MRKSFTYLRKKMILIWPHLQKYELTEGYIKDVQYYAMHAHNLLVLRSLN